MLFTQSTRTPLDFSLAAATPSSLITLRVKTSPSIASMYCKQATEAMSTCFLNVELRKMAMHKDGTISYDTIESLPDVVKLRLHCFDWVQLTAIS